MRCSRLVAGAIGLLLGATPAAAQDLDPRAYAKVPVGFTVAIAGVVPKSLPIANWNSTSASWMGGLLYWRRPFIPDLGQLHRHLRTV
jgi:hypothetical protein